MNGCVNCMYWQPTKPGGGGLCRVGPPQLVMTQGVWPETDQADWCGKYKMDQAKSGFDPKKHTDRAGPM